MVSSQERRPEVEERGGGVGVREGRERQVCTEHRCIEHDTNTDTYRDTERHRRIYRDTETFL